MIRSSVLAILAVLILTATATAEDRQLGDVAIGFNLLVDPDSPLYVPGQTVTHRWIVAPPASGQPVLTEVYVLLRYPKTLTVRHFDLAGADFVCRDDGQAITCIAASVQAGNMFRVVFVAHESAEPYMDLGVVGAPRYHIRKPVEVVKSVTWLPEINR